MLFDLNGLDVLDIEYADGIEEGLNAVVEDAGCGFKDKFPFELAGEADLLSVGANGCLASEASEIWPALLFDLSALPTLLHMRSSRSSMAWCQAD